LWRRHGREGGGASPAPPPARGPDAHPQQKTRAVDLIEQLAAKADAAVTGAGAAVAKR
jgi:hypothetical protein